MDGCGNGSKWEVLYVNRTARRNGAVRIRSAHDYQRINIDFAGGVAFGSDQGMFIMNGSELQLYSANGDVNNNVIMHPAIAEGETEGETCIVTALWDWSPVASWDSGKHWPSWQTPDDGSGMNYFGEGGGCFGVGKSKNVLCMHHHNVAYSSRCGKNMSRLMIPNGASVTPPLFPRKEGSRSEPSGVIYAPMTMGKPPFTEMADKSLTCDGNTSRGDLGVHNKSYECMSHVDLGSVYNWYGGANVAVWRGDTDKHCILCKLTGDQSTWGIKTTPGSVIYALEKGAKLQQLSAVEQDDKPKEDGDGEYAKGKQAAEKRSRHKLEKHFRKTKQLELNEAEPRIPTPPHIEARTAGGNPQWILKSSNFGANWTYVVVPEVMQGFTSLSIDPTNATTLYAVKGNCIARSYDEAETWEPCWVSPGLIGDFHELTIKDSQTMIAFRTGMVPLRTKDGGNSWHTLDSLANLAHRNPGGKYSWSGKTLAISTNPSLFWVSTDDGDTWVDESSDCEFTSNPPAACGCYSKSFADRLLVIVDTALQGGIAQWYDNTLYVCSLGQGISAKVFNETAY